MFPVSEKLNVDTNALLTQIEDSRLWAYFHKDWLLQIRDLLRPQLPAEYYLFVESETILVSPDEAASPMLPDISVAHPDAVPSEAPTSLAAATAAVIDVEEPCEILNQYTLLIRRAPENHVVAVLEILSPSNKGVSNRFDLDQHLRKRNDLLASGVNLLEIDALRKGERILPAPLTNLADYERIAWSASHQDSKRRMRGWGWNETELLPILRWPVEAELEVLVDLPDAVQRTREFNRWDDLVRRSNDN